jgi:hypothetical protein
MVDVISKEERKLSQKLSLEKRNVAEERKDALG